FTGSGRHNEALRTEAVRRGLHVSEYGISDDETGTSEAFTTEEQVFERLGMQHIPPELRENRGELEVARRRELPRLIELGDIRGDLHMHTTLSDGHASVEEMAEAARELGYEYIAITDHSASHGFGDDVQPDALLRRLEEIRSLPDLRIPVLAGNETHVLTGRRRPCPAASGTSAGPRSSPSRSWREPRRTCSRTAHPTTPTTCSSSST